MGSACSQTAVLVIRFSVGWSVRALKVRSALHWIFHISLPLCQVENNMNSVERIVHYATEIEQEAPHNLPEQILPAHWPAKGSMVFRDVVFKYRPELPSVLKGLSMSIQAGEKIGIVGRCVICQYTKPMPHENSVELAPENLRS
jgi:ABC-type multidrug transport system fused ATPase/permease subunit